jgi:hypothetical protein
MEDTSLKNTLLFLLLLLGLASAAQAQSGDFAFGVGTLLSPGPSSAEVLSGNIFTPSLAGGTYLNFSGDFLLKHHLGVNGEIAGRATQAQYLGFQPYRPLFWDFGAIWASRFNRHVGAEATAGLGAESVRFYTGFITCNGFTCTNYTSSNHFMGAFGGGIKLYPYHNFFIRPEARLYLIHNNVEFAGSHAVRVGASIGYTFGGD